MMSVSIFYSVQSTYATEMPVTDQIFSAVLCQIAKNSATDSPSGAFTFREWVLCVLPPAQSTQAATLFKPSIPSGANVSKADYFLLCGTCESCGKYSDLILPKLSKNHVLFNLAGTCQEMNKCIDEPVFVAWHAYLFCDVQISILKNCCFQA